MKKKEDLFICLSMYGQTKSRVQRGRSVEWILHLCTKNMQTLLPAVQRTSSSPFLQPGTLTYRCLPCDQERLEVSLIFKRERYKLGGKYSFHVTGNCVRRKYIR